MCPHTTICVLILLHVCIHINSSMRTHVVIRGHIYRLQGQPVRERADSGGGRLRLASLRYTVPGIEDFTTDIVYLVSGGGRLRLAFLRYTVPGIEDFTTDFSTDSLFS
jgi:hypothetical protein